MQYKIQVIAWLMFVIVSIVFVSIAALVVKYRAKYIDVAITALVLYVLCALWYFSL